MNFITWPVLLNLYILIKVGQYCILPFPRKFSLPFLNINIIFINLWLYMMGTLTVLILSLCQFLLFLRFGLQQKIAGMSNLKRNSSWNAQLLFSHTAVKIIQSFDYVGFKQFNVDNIRKILKTAKTTTINQYRSTCW